MKNKYAFTAVLLAVILLAGVGLMAVCNRSGKESAADGDGLLIVTSFYPMYIAAENIVGDCGGVRLQNLSEPQTGCLHDYQLTAEDMKLLSGADVFIVNGGGIETFLEDVASRYPQLAIVDACEGIDLLEENAHAWMSLKNYTRQLANIRDGLIAADPQHADVYRENEAAYEEQVEGLTERAQETKELLRGRPVILFHEAYGYVADEYGLYVAGEMDLDEERQISAGEVSDIINLIEEDEVPVILAEEQYGREMGEMMASQTGVKVVYLDALTRGDYAADSYIKGMEQNIALLREAFQ